MGDPSEQSFDTTVHQVRAARRGDRQALEALFGRYQGWVIETVALRLGRRLADCHDLEDIAQETLLDAFRSIDRFEHRTEGSFRLWLARIVENNVVDAARRRRAQKRCPDAAQRGVEDEPPSREASPSSAARHREEADLVERAMLQLPPRTREILILRDRCCLSFQEVADTIGLGSSESARTTYRRALQALAGSLVAVGKRP